MQNATDDKGADRYTCKKNSPYQFYSCVDPKARARIIKQCAEQNMIDPSSLKWWILKRPLELSPATKRALPGFERSLSPRELANPFSKERVKECGCFFACEHFFAKKPVDMPSFW